MALRERWTLLVLAVLVLFTVATAVLSFAVAPANPLSLKAERFRTSPATGLALMRLPGEQLQRQWWRAPSAIWLNGRRIPAADSVEDLMRLPGKAYYLKPPNMLYATPELAAALREKDARAVLGNDLAPAWRQRARAGGALVFLMVMFTLLRVVRQPAGAVRPQSAPRMMAITGLRGVAAVIVMMFHLSIPLFGADLWVEFRDGALVRTHWLLEGIKFCPVTRLLLQGGLRVHIFWVLSGLVLALPFLRRGTLEKMDESVAKRYFRLMPLAFVSTMGSFFLQVSGVGELVQEFRAVTGLSLNMWAGPAIDEGSLAGALAAGVFLSSEYNLVLWTLGPELAGSLVLFGILATTMTLQRRRLLWGALWAVFAIYTQHFYLADFMAGLLLAEVVASRGDRSVGLIRPRMAWVLLAASILLGTALPGWLSPWLGPVPDAVGGFMLAIAAAGFVALAAFSEAAARVLSIRPLVWLGERSFAIYVVHGNLLAPVGIGLALGLVKLGIGGIPALVAGVVLYMAVTFWLSDWLTRHVDTPSVALASRLGRWFSGRLDVQRDPSAGKTKKNPARPAEPASTG